MTPDPTSFASPEGTYTYQPGLFPTTYLIPPLNSSASGTSSSSTSTAGAALAMPGVPISLSLGMGMGMGMAMASGSVGGGGFISSTNQLATSPTANINTTNQLLASAQQLAQAGGGGGGVGAAQGSGSPGGGATTMTPGGGQAPPQTVFGNQLPMHPMRATHVEMPMWGMMEQQSQYLSSSSGSAAGASSGSAAGYGSNASAPTSGGQSKSNGLGFLSRGNKAQQQQQQQGAPSLTGDTSSSSFVTPASASYEPSAHSSSEASGAGNGADARRLSDQDDYGMSPPPPSTSFHNAMAGSEKRGGLGGLGLGGFSKGNKQGAWGLGGGGSAAATSGSLPRPKNNLRATNSTFITRVQMHDRFTSMIQHPPQALDPTWSLLPPRTTPAAASTSASRLPPTQRWVFLNIHRTLVWCTIDPTGKCRDALMRLHFSSSPTAHAACEATKQAPGPMGGGSSERLDLVVGFASGDLLWMDPILGKYTRLNKGGIINNTPVVQIRFHPTNSSHVFVTHADGLLFIYALDRDDPAPSVATSLHPWLRFFDRLGPVSRRGTTDSAAALSDFAQASRKPSHGSETEASAAATQQQLQSWRNEEMPTGKSSTTSPWALKNPIAVWKMPIKRMKQFEFSPDGQSMATVSEDGSMRIIDVVNERLTDVFAGYFGGLNCVCWSPDGRFILTGGQDDLITIFSPSEGRVVARCQGHASFVTALAFDRRRCSARGYRFGSVGEDGRIILWDFSSASLQRPRGPGHGHYRRSSQIGSTYSLPRRGGEFEKSMQNLTIGASGGGGNGIEANGSSSNGPTLHPAPMRHEVAMLQAVSVGAVETTLLTSIYFYTDCVMTTARNGMVRVWAKPMEMAKKVDHTRTNGRKAGVGKVAV